MLEARKLEFRKTRLVDGFASSCRAFQNGDGVLLKGIFLARKPMEAFDWRARNERVADLDVCLVSTLLPVVGEWPPRPRIIILPVWFGLWGRWCTGWRLLKGQG